MYVFAEPPCEDILCHVMTDLPRILYLTSNDLNKDDPFINSMELRFTYNMQASVRIR